MFSFSIIYAIEHRWYVFALTLPSGGTIKQCFLYTITKQHNETLQIIALRLFLSLMYDILHGRNYTSRRERTRNGSLLNIDNERTHRCLQVLRLFSANKTEEGEG